MGRTTVVNAPPSQLFDHLELPPVFVSAPESKEIKESSAMIVEQKESRVKKGVRAKIEQRTQHRESSVANGEKNLTQRIESCNECKES